MPQYSISHECVNVRVRNIISFEMDEVGEITTVTWRETIGETIIGERSQ